jgi:hypothetical protein
VVRPCFVSYGSCLGNGVNSDVAIVNSEYFSKEFIFSFVFLIAQTLNYYGSQKCILTQRLVQDIVSVGDHGEISCGEQMTCS